MKKTLIAVALSASTMISMPVIAATWTADGTGGSVDLGGTLTQAPVTPWEVAVGDAVTGLDVEITKDSTTAALTLTKAIPFLSIRTRTNQAFAGNSGITPNITFGTATTNVLSGGWATGVTTLTLDIVDPADVTKILGTVSAPFTAAAVGSYAPAPGSAFTTKSVRSLYSSSPGYAFYGGLSIVSGSEVMPLAQAKVKLSALNSAIADNFDSQGASDDSVFFRMNTADTSNLFSAYYGAGIESGKKLTFNLTNAAGTTDIAWKASLPVTVSYQ